MFLFLVPKPGYFPAHISWARYFTSGGTLSTGCQPGYAMCIKVMLINSASAIGGGIIKQKQGAKANKSPKGLCPLRHIWKTKWRVPRIDLATGVGLLWP